MSAMESAFAFHSSSLPQRAAAMAMAMAATLLMFACLVLASQVPCSPFPHASLLPHLLVFLLRLLFFFWNLESRGLLMET